MKIIQSHIKEKLEYHYKAFDKSQLMPDPLQFPHLFDDEKDIEVMTFIASVFAYGSVKQIINALNKFLLVCNNKPYKFIQSFSMNKTISKNFVHRFYSTDDIIHLFQLLNMVYNKFGSLKKLFLSGYQETDSNTKNAITIFLNHFLQKAQTKFGPLSGGLKFMFPLPEKGSACKRINLFLRWMVREDDLDFGLWGEIPTSKLVIPVDTHIAKICKQLKLTNRKNVSWKMAEEITNNLKKFDPNDPVKYDFALCHIGMRKLTF